MQSQQPQRVANKCLVSSGYPSKILRSGLFEPHMSVSHKSIGWKAKFETAAHRVLVDGSLLGLQMASYCLAVNSQREGERGASNLTLKMNFIHKTLSRKHPE